MWAPPETTCQHSAPTFKLRRGMSNTGTPASRGASRRHRDPVRAINDGGPLLTAKVGRPSVDLGQRQRSFGAHAMFSRT